MKKDFALTQPQRLLSLCIDLIVVFIACNYLFGTPYPPLGDKGFWAYSALLSVLIGSKLATPFYVKPVDAISYAIPAAISLLLVNKWPIWSANQQWGFVLAMAPSLVVGFFGILTISLNSSHAEWAKELSNKIRIGLDLIGQPEYIYTPLVLFSIFCFHAESWIEAVVIGMVTGTTVWWSLGNFTVGGFNKIKRTFTNNVFDGAIGEVVAFQDPGIVLLRQQHEGDINKYDLLYISDKHGPKKLVAALDFVGRAEGILIRAVELKNLSAVSNSAIDASPIDETVYKLKDDILDKICRIENLSRDSQTSIVGLVAPDTTIERLYFEIVQNSELEEGRLVSTKVGQNKVLYQIVGGLTKEEIVQQKNTYGYLRGQAQQIGVWNDAFSKFSQCNWLPTLNTPVYLEKRSEYQVNINSVGHFPETNFHAKIKSISDLVTHNTAILGILGIGKSMLAIELIERIMAEGIKVICLDLTNQYEQELNDFYDSTYEEHCLAKLQAASEKDREELDNNPEHGGSLPNLRDAIYADISDFLSDNNNRPLKIYNPSSFVATKQQREPSQYKVGNEWRSRAGLFSVTPVEITQIISESTLSVLSTKMSPTARVCLVYEEAHSLIPEWNSVVNEGDKNATSGTARAILQGRKYGLGCLLITQRTANVTKTILNQCNTVFAMRTFDETGKEFLANYIGRDYASTLSSLPERHAVFFGKASSCENPVLIRLNDQSEFRTTFRAAHPPLALQEFRPIIDQNPVIEDRTDEFDDDIPF
ncbi:MAG: DUF87 domain-containing protein [Steroidobacteraceae bacterium]